MKTKKIILLLTLITLVASCSKDVKKTSAKLNLKLSGIVNLSSGIGSGGAILFGKSTTGEQFGKVVAGTEENLDLPNGDWTFYTLMWEKTTGNNLSDVVYCGKSSEKLTGAAVSINLDLSNANCADNDFSGGQSYSQYVSGVGMKNTFAKFYVEDCDDLAKTGNITCSLPNQGNALSYRVNFRSYKKLPGAAPFFNNEIIRSQCVNVNTLHSSGMNINFPTSNSAMPFVASVEMYLSSTDCAQTVPETKGMYTHVLPQGLGGANPGSKIVFNGGYSCTPANSIMTDVCADYMGTMSGGNCTVPAVISNFVAPADCSSPPSAPTTTSFRNIKQMISVPKSVFCFADVSNLGVSGTDVFPAGNGSAIRPFKICNEWQINQIGEVGASALMSTYHYKLLNDLDMNKTDFGIYPKPTCSGVVGTLIDKHHNFNPLDGLFDGACDTEKSLPSFTGSFNGNNKIISHARIYAESSDMVGFVRRMESGVIKDLNFENLEVRGMQNVGGLAGAIYASGVVEIRNIKIKGFDLEGKYNSVYPGSATNLGAISGIAMKSPANIVVDQFTVSEAEIYGQNVVGGLVGYNNATIQRSKFSGLLNVHGGTTGSSVGGLVATNYNGIIASSLSEGMINSNSKYIGGIAALNESSSSVMASYSTMFINSFASETSPYVGGIVSKNTASSYENVYFDGVISFMGSGTTPILHSISNGDTSASATGVCLYTDIGSPIGACAPISRGDLMAGNLFAGDTLWQASMLGTVPRLKWEQETNSRPCLMTGNTESVLTQKNTLSRGTSSLNPIVICNPSQLSALSSLSAGNIAMLGDNINLSDWTEADLISSFSGILEGRGKSLYGLNISGAALNASGVAIIKNNSGTIVNLDVVGNKISSIVQMPYSGILTAKNSGVISNVYFHENSLTGYTNVGIISGNNSGTIDHVEIRNGNVEGHSAVGGAVGQNTLSTNSIGGKILRVSSHSMLKDRSTIFSNFSGFGGVVGNNCSSCTVDQVLFDGSLALSSYITSANPANIGGVVGINAGTLSNALTKNSSFISSSVTEGVGGLTGSNSGIVRTSIALGSVQYLTPSYIPMSVGSKFSATVGSTLGGGTSTSLYFIENKIGTVVAQDQTSTICSGTSATFVTNLFASPGANTPDLYSRSYYNNYNDSLSSLSSVSILSDNSMSFVDSCAGGEFFTFIKSFGTAGMPASSFSDPTNFSGLNMGYPGYLEENVLEYHKARMYNRAPAMAIPIWYMDEGDSYPRLLQIHD